MGLFAVLSGFLILSRIAAIAMIAVANYTFVAVKLELTSPES
jgi:hypothetical protein